MYWCCVHKLFYSYGLSPHLRIAVSTKIWNNKSSRWIGLIALLLFFLQIFYGYCIIMVSVKCKWVNFCCILSMSVTHTQVSMLGKYRPWGYIWDKMYLECSPVAMKEPHIFLICATIMAFERLCRVVNPRRLTASRCGTQVRAEQFQSKSVFILVKVVLQHSFSNAEDRGSLSSHSLSLVLFKQISCDDRLCFACHVPAVHKVESCGTPFMKVPIERIKQMKHWRVFINFRVVNRFAVERER